MTLDHEAQPALSVVLPVHNGMPYVERSVASVLAQTFTDFELLIGDDGSTDGTAELLHRFSQRDRRVRILRHERKSGIAASAHWLVGQAKAPIVAMAHADDWSDPERLHWQMLGFRQDERLQLLGTLASYVDAEGRVVRGAERWRLLRPSTFAPFPHSSVMFRTEAYHRVGGYRSEAEYWEDLDLYLRIGERGKIGVLAHALVNVRHSGMSTRMRDDQDAVENAVDAMYRCVRLYRKGLDYHPILLETEEARSHRKLHPRTFVACGWTTVLNGRRPQLCKRMLLRARFGLDLDSALSLGWMAIASASPRLLRAIVKLVSSIRTRLANCSTGPDVLHEWNPRAKASRTAGTDLAKKAHKELKQRLSGWVESGHLAQ